MLPFSSLSRFCSKIETASEDFEANYQHNSGLVKTLNDRLGEWSFEGKPHRVAQIRKEGKLLARERLSLLLDEDSPFLEIGPLCGWGQKGQKQGNSSVCGIGVVSGVECMVVTNVFTVQAAAMNTVTASKWARCSEIALENNLPFIHLLESAGADLNQQFESFHVSPNPFYQLAKMSKKKIPSICVVMGTCIAGGAYMGGVSDYNIMIRGQSHLALAGEKLVFQATGENSTREELGGAEMHSTKSGVSDFLANNEQEAIKQAREVVATFPARKQTEWETQKIPVQEPFYNPDEILGILSRSNKSVYDCREIMARLTDGSYLSEFKPSYGNTIVCAFAYVYGVPVGLIGNNGVIMSEAAQKGCHFINICNQRGIPIIFLHNVTGFMVGRKYEESGIIKWGSQLVNAVSNCTIPAITFIIGSSFGAANYALRGHGFEPRFIFSWPNSKCAVMGPDQLSGVLDMLAREGAKKKGATADEEKLNAARNKMIEKIEREQDCYYLSSHMVDDGVIDPRDTRMILGFCLSIVANTTWEAGFLEGICRL